MNHLRYSAEEQTFKYSACQRRQFGRNRPYTRATFNGRFGRVTRIGCPAGFKVKSHSNDGSEEPMTDLLLAGYCRMR